MAHTMHSSLVAFLAEAHASFASIELELDRVETVSRIHPAGSGDPGVHGALAFVVRKVSGTPRDEGAIRRVFAQLGFHDVDVARRNDSQGNEIDPDLFQVNVNYMPTPALGVPRKLTLASIKGAHIVRHVGFENKALSIFGVVTLDAPHAVDDRPVLVMENGATYHAGDEILPGVTAADFVQAWSGYPGSELAKHFVATGM